LSRSAVPLREAALELRRSVDTLQAWIRQGAPTASLGAVGRGRGALVVVDELRRWRAGRASGDAQLPISVDLGAIARAILRAHVKPTDGRMFPTWKAHRTVKGAAAAQAYAIFQALAVELTGRPVPEASLPSEMLMILGISADCARLANSRVTEPTR